MLESEFEAVVKQKENFKVSQTQYECPVCKKLFKVRGFLTHVHKQHLNADRGIKNSGGYNGHYNSPAYKEKISKASIINNQKRYGKLVEINTTCSRCGKPITVKVRGNKVKKYFCSTYCAQVRDFPQEVRQKIGRSTSISIKKKYQTDKVYRQKIFTHLANSKYFTSKNQILIRNYIKQKHTDDCWTFGGGLKCDEFVISRDLYSNKLKICFQYDGFVHFKDAFGQLQDKRAKDAALEKWCIQHNWRLVRISQSWFIRNGAKPQLIQNLLYNTEQPIIKLGDQYNVC